MSQIVTQSRLFDWVFLHLALAGATVDSIQPLNISCDNTCLSISTVNIYLFSPDFTRVTIHVWQGVRHLLSHGHTPMVELHFIPVPPARHRPSWPTSFLEFPPRRSHLYHHLLRWAAHPTCCRSFIGRFRHYTRTRHKIHQSQKGGCRSHRPCPLRHRPIHRSLLQVPTCQAAEEEQDLVREGTQVRVYHLCHQCKRNHQELSPSAGTLL